MSSYPYPITILSANHQHTPPLQCLHSLSLWHYSHFHHTIIIITFLNMNKSTPPLLRFNYSHTCYYHPTLPSSVSFLHLIAIKQLWYSWISTSYPLLPCLSYFWPVLGWQLHDFPDTSAPSTTLYPYSFCYYPHHNNSTTVATVISILTLLLSLFIIIILSSRFTPLISYISHYSSLPGSHQLTISTTASSNYLFTLHTANTSYHVSS